MNFNIKIMLFVSACLASNSAFAAKNSKKRKASEGAAVTSTAPVASDTKAPATGSALSASAASGKAPVAKRFKTSHKAPSSSASSSSASASSAENKGANVFVPDADKALKQVLEVMPKLSPDTITSDLLDYMAQTDEKGFLIIPDAAREESKKEAAASSASSAPAMTSSFNIEDVIKKALQRTERSSWVTFCEDKVKNLPHKELFANKNADGQTFYSVSIEGLWAILDARATVPRHGSGELDDYSLILLKAIDTRNIYNLTNVSPLGNTLLHVLAREWDYWDAKSPDAESVNKRSILAIAEDILVMAKAIGHDCSFGTHTIFGDEKLPAPEMWTSVEKCAQILKDWQAIRPEIWKPGAEVTEHRLKGLDNDKNYSPRKFLWKLRNTNTDGALHAFVSRLYWYVLVNSNPDKVPFQRYVNMFQALLDAGLHPDSKNWAERTFLQELFHDIKELKPVERTVNNSLEKARARAFKIAEMAVNAGASLDVADGEGVPLRYHYLVLRDHYLAWEAKANPKAAKLSSRFGCCARR